MGGGSGRGGGWSVEKDRWIFFRFFILGVVSILVLKAWVDNQFVVTLVPCVLMLWYAAQLWNFRAGAPKPGATGDNLYYLGFLYTLTSLGHSLYRFSTAQEDTETIVTNFGIAISTTILGMALRILLGRTGADDPAEIESSARLDLASSGRRLRAELEYTVDDFKDFRERLQEDFKSLRDRLAQDAGRVHDAVSKTIERTLSIEQTIANFETGTELATEAITARAQELESSAAALIAFEQAVERLRTRTDAASAAIGRRADDLDAGAGSIRAALEAQAARMQAVDFRQILIDAADPAATALQAGLDRAAAQVDTRIGALLQGAEQHASALADGASAVRDSLQAQAERIGTVDFPDAFRDAVRPASNDLHAAAAEFKASLDGLRQADAARERALAAHERAQAALTEALQGQQTVAVAVADAASNSRDAAGAFRSAGDRLAGFNEAAGDATRELGAVRSALAQSAERLRAVTEELTKASESLASWVEGALPRPRRRSWFSRWRR